MSTIARDEMMDHVVQAGSQVVRDLAGNNAKPNEVFGQANGIAEVGTVDVCTTRRRLRIFLDGKHAWASVQQSIILVMKLIKVPSGPFDFRP